MEPLDQVHGLLQTVIFLARALGFLNGIPCCVLLQFVSDGSCNINLADGSKFNCKHQDVSEFVRNVLRMLWRSSQRMGLRILDPTEMVGQFSHLGRHRQDQILGVVELQPITLLDKLSDGLFEISQSRFVIVAHVFQSSVEQGAKWPSMATAENISCSRLVGQEASRPLSGITPRLGWDRNVRDLKTNHCQ